MNSKRPFDGGHTIAQDGWISRADGFTKGTSQVTSRPPAPAPIARNPAPVGQKPAPASPNSKK